MGKEWLGEWDGQLCVVSEDTLSSAPVLIRKYWPVGIKAYDFKRNYGSDLMGRRVYPTGPSSHGIYGIEGVRFQVQLINGGQTIPVHFVKEPIKPPKVKAGIEVRYVEGRWQKYLKSRGWTDAKKGRSHAKPSPLKAETIKFYGTVLEPKTVDHYGSRYFLKYASTKTPAKMRADAMSWETGRKILVREAENAKGVFCVYLGPKIDAKRGKRA